MRHTLRRRSSPDPLAALPEPTWLVVRDPFGNAIEVTPLEPQADLRSILNTAQRAPRCGV